MPRDPRAYLWDARRAVALVVEFVAGRSWADYEADALNRPGFDGGSFGWIFRGGGVPPGFAGAIVPPVSIASL